jgi:hypothetical protein
MESIGTSRAVIAEQRDEERITGQHALAGTNQLVEQPATLGIGIEGGCHRDALAHEHHPAGLGEHRFARVERDDDRLQVVADDLVIDFVSRHHFPPLGRTGAAPPAVVLDILT